MLRLIKQLCAVVAASFLLAAPAYSVPIPFAGGSLEAHLNFYDVYEDPSDGLGYALLRREYVLGTDFMAGVPGSADPSTMVAYSANIDFPASAFWTPLDAPLDDACTSATTDSRPGRMSVAIRGTCTFMTKWANMEAKGASGGILVNNVPGLVGLGGIDQSVSIPFLMVTQDVWSELFLASNLVDASGNVIQARAYYPILTMDVTWTPNSTVPEPMSIFLVCIALVGLGVTRRLAT